MVSIPATMASIGDSAFVGCTALDSVTIHVETPYAFGAAAFSAISDHCVLIVPYGKAQAYREAGWTEQVFKGGIKEMPMPAGIRQVRAGTQEDVYYDLQGRPVAHPQKGKIYIVQDRKVVAGMP